MTTFYNRNIGLLVIGSIIFLIGSSLSAAPLYYTDFDKTVYDIDPADDFPDNWTALGSSSSWYISDANELRGSGLINYTGQLSSGAAASTLTDYTVSTTFRKATNYAGIIGRVQDSDSFYHLRVSNTNQALQLYRFDSGATMLKNITMDEPYVPGQSWQLSMSFDGSDICGMVHNAAGDLVGMLAANDSTFNGGTAGFRATEPFVAEDFTVEHLAIQSISTADGNGADTYVGIVDGSVQSNTGSITRVETKNVIDVENKKLFRKTYLRFDVSDVEGTSEDAMLQLVVHGFGQDSSNKTFNIYGLSDGLDGENWDENTIVYSDAPANTSVAENNNELTSDAVLLGTTLGGSGLTNVTFGSSSLLDFINEDTNGLVTLIITVDPQVDVWASPAPSFYSKEDGAGENAPQLILFQSEEEGPLLPGDANGDGKVDAEDASILAGNWQTPTGATWAMGDFNEDGRVDDIDATLLATNWQGSGAVSVPEPSSLVLLAGIMTVCFLRRKNG